ncbi:MAG: L-lactate dehydrogenase [Candidatus Margulisiibacteriota bacterium]|nr:MAG: hypothetical protein A2X41_09010 [Candidatus Margulisbacteria bacterium GWE2_39_32]PZM78263.1 MAG: L-lactate dehydrogenase [Candidatus Margulisiibacteriota bacterium]HCT84219.1 L-lactate dehydrogenase [Candidatus Margulisiibacteriota bacterium]HCY35538.1 L-lactate dehydrogenase [Candidatus Margulisiibacteriota bacterium]
MKVSIVGCGHFGSILAYTLFLRNFLDEITLIDEDINKATRTAYDLNQASPIVGSTKVFSGGFEKLIDADIVVIAAGIRRKEGDSRLDLSYQNYPIVQDITEKIAEYNTKCILIVATNPVDIMTYVALKVSGFPKERVIGLGTLNDMIRMRYFIASKLQLNPRDINLIIIGEHGDSMVPLFSSANVAGIPLNKIIGFDDLIKKEVIEKTRKSGEKIISLGGSPSYAPATAATLLIENIAFNSKNIVPVSTFSSNIYEIENICLSLPARVGSKGIEEILVPSLNEDELTLLHHSYETLQKEIDKLFKN